LNSGLKGKSMLKNITIRHKLFGSFSFLFILIVATLVMALNSLNDMNERLNHLAQVSTEKVKLGARINQGVIAISRAEKNIILSSVQTEMDEFADFIEETQSDMRLLREQLRELVDDDGKMFLDEFAETWDAYLILNKQLRETARLNSNVRAREMSQNEGREAYDKAAATITEIINLNDLETEGARELESLQKITEKIKLGALISRNLVEIQRAEKNIILAKSQSEMDVYVAASEDVKNDLDERLDVLEPLTTGQGRILVRRFIKEYKSYILLHEEIRKTSRENGDTRAFELSTGEARIFNDRAISQMAAIVDKNERDIDDDKLLSDKNYQQARLVLLIFAITGLLLGGGFVFLIVGGINQSLNKVNEVIKSVADGDLIQEIDINIKDEVGDVLRSISDMVLSLTKVTEFSQNIARGDYSQKIELRSKKDLLGISINEMSQALKTLEEDNQQKDWLKTGQNELNETMRGDLDEKTLAQNVLSYLAHYLNAQIGTFYQKVEQTEALQLMSSFAYTKRKSVNDIIEIGEGLAGQAAFEKKMILVTNLPEDYTRVSSTLGDSMPRNVVVSPFLFEGELNGVIELGSFEEFTDIQMELIDSVMDAIAINLNSTHARRKLSETLEETQLLSEELQSQSEDLRVTNEELEEKSERMQSQAEELQLANNNLELQKSQIEKKSKDVELKAEELAIASKYKSEFLSNMSHELRTPLNSMLLLSSSLAKNKQGNMTVEQVQSATIVNQGGQDLLSLINDILDLSKIEVGMMEVELTSFLIGNVVKDLKRNFNHVMVENDLDFIINIDPKLPDAIHSDQKRLNQILKNFISNAVKFTKKGSISLYFSRPKDDVNLSRSGLVPSTTLSIAVTDTGMGIPEDKQKVIFEAFQQADGGTARNYGGTGLGLSISRELTALLGGEIQLQSQTDKGSTFTLYIPLDGKETQRLRDAENPISDVAANVEAAPAIKPSGSSMASFDYQVEDDREFIRNIGFPTDGPRPDDQKILLVIEDDPQFAEILVKQSRDHGFMCIATANGEEGLSLAEQYLPDGIVLDLHLPGVDGRYVLNALKDNLNIRHIPVHIMSVDDEKQDTESRGAIGFLSKPVDQEQLDEAFQKFLKYSNKAVKNLLIIEDDDATRLAIKQVIGNGDVKITESTTGNEGLQMLISGSFDCVILDLSLSDISGFEVLEKLELQENFQVPPIIIYTGKDLSKKDHQRLLKYTDSIVIKGVDSEDRLLDETSLFLHRIVGKMTQKKRKIIHDLYDMENVFKGKKVMVVDDDMRNIFAVSQLLEEKGCIVIAAEDGKSALEILKKEPKIDLVLMDIMMPVMDGYEATRKIRKQAKFKKLPIIALTAKAMKDDREKCIIAGVSDYLTKPLNEQRLFSMLRIWLYK
jgi:CheY-like chemotaxis protein/signal transduction histidine kinase/HAMP domain-containing protein